MAFTAPEDELLQEEGFTAPEDEILEFNTGQGPIESAAAGLGRGFGKAFTGSAEGLGQFSQSYIRNLNPVGWAAKAGVPGAQELVDIASAPGRFVEELGASGTEALEEALPVNPLYADTIGQKAAETIGQAGGQLASIFTGAAVTKAPKVLQILGLGQAGLMGLESGYGEADRLGITEPWERDTLAAIYAASEAGVEGMGGFGSPSFSKAIAGEVKELLTGTAAKKAIKTAVSEGIEEPITGTLQAAGSNLMAEEDPNRPGFTTSGAPIPSLDPTSGEFLSARAEEAFFGTLGGGVFAGAQYAMTRPKLEQAKKLHQKILLTETLLEDKPNPTPQDVADLEEIRENKHVVEEVITEAEKKLAVPEDVPETPVAQATAILAENVDAPEVSATVEALAAEIAATPEAETPSIDIAFPKTVAAEIAPLEEAAAVEAEAPFIAPEDEVILEEAIPVETPTAPENAIQIQEPAQGVPREERPEMELQPVGEGDTQGQEIARASEETAVAPVVAPEEALPAPAPVEPPPRPLTLAERFPEVEDSPEVAMAKSLSFKQKARAAQMWEEGAPIHEITQATGLPDWAAPALQRVAGLPERNTPEYKQWVTRRNKEARTSPLPPNPSGEGDILDWLTENKIYVPPKAQRGGEVDFLSKDDRISRYYRQFITTNNDASDTADVVAGNAVREGLLPEGSTSNELADAIEAAIKARNTTRAQIKREGARMKEAEAQTKRFYKDTAKGDVTVDPNDLVTGDLLIVEDTELKVTEVESDDEGRVLSVTLQDGKRYGVQEVSGDYVMLADEFKPKARKAEVEFVPAEELEEPAQEPKKVETPKAEPPTVSLESQTPEQVQEERQRAARKDELRRRMEKKLAGSAGEYGTPDMLDTTAGETPLFSQPERNPARTSRQQPKTSVLSTGVTHKNADAAARGLKGILPNIESAWFGDRQELAGQTRMKEDWISGFMKLNPGMSQQDAQDAFTEWMAFGLNNIEGFTVAGRTYVMLDQVQVTTDDATPARAVRRILIHEDAHEAVEALLARNEAAKKKWESIRNDIPAESLDDLASRRYPWMKEWRDSAEIHDNLAHEWFAERMETEEKRGDPVEDSLIERFKAWLRDIMAQLLDRPAESFTHSDLLRFVEAGRRARFQSPGNATRYSAQGPDNISPREVEAQINGETTAPAQIVPGAKTQWRYNYWGEKRRQAYTSYQNNPAVPEELKNFTQFMGNPTTNVRLRQALPRMVDQARAFLGGTNNEQPEVTEENTERAYAVAKELLTRKTFARRYIQSFQDVWSPKDNEGRPIHQGSAAVAVLQMELMDYAVRLASTGDIKLARKLGPFANDVILGDYMTMSNAARALQVRSHAVKDSGFWTALQLTSQGALQLAEENVGRDKLAELNQAFWGVDVIEQVEREMDREAATAPEVAEMDRADAAERDAYEMEGWWQRAKDALDEAERADLDALEQAMRQYDLLLQRRTELQAKAGNVAKPSAQEDLAKFQTVGEINAEIAKVKGSIREILKRLTKTEDSAESQETRKKRTRKHKAALKDLSADEQVKALLDKLESQKKRTKKGAEKPAWRAVYEKQIKEPKSRESFLAAMDAVGVSRQMADRLFDIAGELTTARNQRKVERARAREAAQEEEEPEENKATTEAVKAIDNFDEEQTEWLPKARTKGDSVKGVIYDAVRDPRPDNAGMNRDAFMRYYRGRLEGLEVTPEVAWTLADRLWNQNRKLPANKLAKQRFRIERQSNTRGLETSLEEATLEELQDPEWKRQRAREHFQANGMMQKDAEAAVLEMDDKRIDALISRAQRKVDARAFDAVEGALEADLQRPTRLAQKMIDRLDERQTEAMPKDPAKRDAVERAATAAIKEERTDPQRPAGQRMTKDRFIKDTAQALKDAGVEAGAAVNLAERLYAENQRQQAGKVLRKRKSASNSRAFINSIVRSILSSPLSQQADPEWRRDTMVNAFRERGMMEDQAEKAADWLNFTFQKHLNEAQAKAAFETAQKLGIKTLSLERLREAVRSRALDPLINNPAVEALARAAGFRPLTNQQFQELARLDTKIAESGPTEASKYYTQMHNILASAKPPKKVEAMLTQGWINSALSSLSTAMLNIVHPVFVMGRRFMLDLGSLTADVLTGKVKLNDAVQTYVQMMGNWMRAFENFVDDARFSLKNDAYSNRMLEVLNVAHGMHTDMMEAAAVLKDPNASIADRGKALVKVIFTSTDFMRRFLSTADQTWGSVVSQYVVRNEAMRTLMQEAGLSSEAAGIILSKANTDGLAAMNQHLNKTGDAVESRLVGRDVMQESLAQAVAAATGRDTAGIELITTARKEGELELGNRASEKGAWFDPVNFLAEIFKEIAWKIRRAGGESAAEAQGWRELVGRMATGFVTVPANILNRSAYFSPLGIGRALYRLKGSAAMKDHYTETMATEGQARMRLTEGIVGTVGMLLLAMLKMRDDEDEGWNLTGEGPKDKGLREAWAKKGHKPAHIEYVDKKGNVLFSMPWARGGLDHLALPLTLIGTLDDMELNGLKRQPKNFSWAAAYGKDALVGLANQARFFGMKNLISAPSAFSEKSLAGTVAYSAAPIIPWAGLQKSIARMMTGQLDQSSVQSAVLAQMPLGISLAGTPALNALGDPRGIQPRDFATKASERLEGAGIPVFLGMDVESQDGRLYSFMLEKGVSPSLPLRATMEAKNGFLRDEVWEKYLKTRGAIIKAELYRELAKLRLMKQPDLQERIERISSQATKAAKKKMRLN